jgi:hypothetical protein
LAQKGLLVDAQPANTSTAISATTFLIIQKSSV